MVPLQGVISLVHTDRFLDHYGFRVRLLTRPASCGLSVVAVVFSGGDAGPFPLAWQLLQEFSPRYLILWLIVYTWEVSILSLSWCLALVFSFSMAQWAVLMTYAPPESLVWVLGFSGSLLVPSPVVSFCGCGLRRHGVSCVSPWVGDLLPSHLSLPVAVSVGGSGPHGVDGFGVVWRPALMWFNGPVSILRPWSLIFIFFFFYAGIGHPRISWP